MIRLALLIAAATAAGCSLAGPEKADPANLPSPSYLTDDVQYYAPGPEYYQAMEEAKLKAEKEAHAAEQDR